MEMDMLRMLISKNMRKKIISKNEKDVLFFYTNN